MKNQPNFIYNNISITEKTYYRMGGVARYFAMPKTLLEIKETILFCRENVLPCALLGSGSNCVYSDKDFDGLILSLELLNAWHWENEQTLFVEAGVSNTEIAEICAAEDRAGASWMYRMPGQIGATIRMNARCYGGEISQIAKEILTINSNGDLILYAAQDIFHGYKKTLLMESPHIVVAVRLFFPQKECAQNLITHMFECEADRHSKHHFDFPSCGSTFKNNYQIGKPSGKIFDELGLKGKQFGNAAISEFHGNFIWNLGQAKTEDMLNLCAFMRQEAKKTIKANLELEVQPIGVFPPTLYTKCGMAFLGPSYLTKNNHRWVGLFYFPDKTVSHSPFCPKTIFSSFFIDYHHKSCSGAPQIQVHLEQLNSYVDAQKKRNEPFLKWETKCFESPEKLFFKELKPSDEDKFVQQLWDYSVSELFLANAQSRSAYLEFEITPKKSWIGIEFHDVRIPINKEYKQTIHRFANKNNEKNSYEFSFGMIFTYEDLACILSTNSKMILIQCALSLGNERYLLAPYWKTDQIERADFHQPHRFWSVEFF